VVELKVNVIELESLLKNEIAQKWEEGYEVESAENKLSSIKSGEVADKTTLFRSLYDELDLLSLRKDFHFVEPSLLNSIKKERSEGPRKLEVELSREEYQNKVYGAWLGRCAGCLLGKPVEGWHREKIEEYLTICDSYPLDNYIPEVIPHQKEFTLHSSYKDAVRGKIYGMPRDDDIDFTILGLHILEEHGLEFTTENVADEWLSHFPYNLIYTAERAAYKNLVNGLLPPETATFRNPYREWIGAQIRGDIWGYISPGLPEVASELAYRDASLSHVKNGIYGEMFVAAMVSVAFALNNVKDIIEIGLSEIPKWSRLAEAAKNVILWSETDEDWQSTWEKIMWAYGDYSWVHTINNAAFVILGLLYGEGDFEKSITIGVMAGLDTDCNGGTIGSIIGAILGAKEISSKWVSPIDDRVRSCLAGFSESRISELSKRTCDLRKT
jgi:ADP-ribosylglycohydrolase